MLPPKIDPRSVQDLMRKMEELVPYYTPEWRFSIDDPDPGAALFMIFSEMFQENIKRFNQVPYKQFISFLNTLDVRLLSSRSASAYLSFQLSNGSEESVFIPSGTQVSASVVTDQVEEILFETSQNMLITPATLQKSFVVNGYQDQVVAVNEEIFIESDENPAKPFTLFETEQSQNLQEHAIYLTHPFLLNLSSSAQVEISLSKSYLKYEEAAILNAFANQSFVEWGYWQDDGWVAFDEVFVQNHRIYLRKTQFGKLTQYPIHEFEAYWIRCLVKPGRIHDLLETVEDFTLDEIKFKVDYYDSNDAGGIIPDKLFEEDREVEKSGFYPFGEYFAPYSTFYIASEEVLSKKHGKVSILFDLKVKQNIMKTAEDPDINWKWVMKEKDLKKKELPRLSISQVIWEYWDGFSWSLLTVDSTSEELFYKPQEGPRRIEFECPSNLEETYVNGQLNYWIRVRVNQMDQIMFANTIYLSPWLENFKMLYTYDNKNFYPEKCVTQNNLEYRENTENTRGQTKPFSPFIPLDNYDPSFYLAFDKEPKKGPISLYLSLERSYYTEDQTPEIEWQYLRRNGTKIEWERLKMFDQTGQMTESGMLQFIGPDDFVRSSLFNEVQYWIRAVYRDWKTKATHEIPLPVMKGIYLNTIQAVQQETIHNEFPQPISSDFQWEYSLVHSPVLSANVWVDETGHLMEEELLILQNTHEVKVMRDSEGNLQKCWVKWEKVRHFMSSGIEDRHYVLNAATGRIRFGDGKMGKIPQNQGSEYINVKYTVGGGMKGNVPRKEITQLQNALAFVQSVSNPEPAVGGADMETMEEAIQRGPQLFKHRNRAVTAEDFEWLVMQKFQHISKVKCLPNMNARLEKELGAVTMVVLPKGNERNGDLFVDLKPQLEQFLLTRTAGSIAFIEAIHVIEPAYLEVSVNVKLIVKHLDVVHATEEIAKSKIIQFLNPNHGHYDGKGWEIGEEIHPTLFYALLRSIDAVNHVDRLFLHVVKVEHGQRVEIDANQLMTIKHGVIHSGKHNVIVDVL